jgi:hypothetical protein
MSQEGISDDVMRVFRRGDEEGTREVFETFDLQFSPENGLDVTPRGLGASGYEVGDRRVYEWVEVKLRDSGLDFGAVTTWGLVMVALQVSVLILLTFEAPGPQDGNGIVRYISDNIAAHQGFGGVMLLSFAGSFLLLSVVSLPPLLVGFSVLLIGGTALGGAGVVFFHGEYEWQHIGCATGFIASGLALHIVAIYTGPWRWRHTVRDAVFLLVTFTAAGLFAGFLVTNKLYIENTQDALNPLDRYSPRDPRLRWQWWVSGVAEYMLYINICVLNVFVGQRVFEHTAWSVFTALPVLLARHEGRAI